MGARLAAVLEAVGASGLLASSVRLVPDAWISGADESPGIVSVSADTNGHARIWRRAGERVEASEARFPPWFLTRQPDLLAHLPVRWLPAADFAFLRPTLEFVDGVTVVELEGGGPDAFRYLVLADALDEVESTVVETWNKRTGSQAQSFADLTEFLAIWPPIEQLLMLTGRTYFKGMEFADLRRLQFDLETTGLNEQRDRIFMISLSDSTGWQASLDTNQMTEAELLQRFVQLVRERDPDVLENHNIFAFDLRFLARRAASLGVRLALGRDGSEPVPAPDVLYLPDRSERFIRWRVAGREVVDTLHAVKRYSAVSQDLRRHGLKEAARHFGFAKPDREYVPGAEIWRTFQHDPDRVRRYAADDVHEANGLSRRLMGIPFVLASIVPRAFERIATDMSPAGTIDPILVRAYLQAGRALPAPAPRGPRSSRAGPRPDLFLRGVVRPALRLDVRPLFPHVLAEMGVSSPGDQLGALPAILTSVLQQAAQPSTAAVAGEEQEPPVRSRALVELAELVPAYLASPGVFFADPGLATRVQKRGRAAMTRLLAALHRAGATLVEVHGESVLLGVPEDWDEAREHALTEALRLLLPPGVRVERVGRYRSLYARAERSHAFLAEDGSVRLLGDSILTRGLEPFGEHFIHHAAHHVLTEDLRGLRVLFVDQVRRLRAGEVSVEDLCVQSTLRKSPAEYRDSPYREEAYEVAIASGLVSWRPSVRIRYFRDRSGQPRILQEGEPIAPLEADVEYYVQRLRAVYCPYFVHAFQEADFDRLFEVPAPGTEPFAVDPSVWADVRTIRKQVRTAHR